MATKGIEVILDGDSRDLVRSLAEAENELKELQKTLKNTTDGKELVRLGKRIGEVKNEIKGINTQAASANLNKLGKSSVDASGDLINLGRVVQDAPFGFLGIANNLNPLIDGFKRTATASGGLTGGLKALGASLVGAGGLSLLVSGVSTALILFGDKLFAASAGNKALKESIEGSSKAIGDDLAKLTTLVGVIQNVNTSQSDRQKALKALNQEYESYLKNLGLENVGLDKVGAAYEKIIDLMLRQAVVKGIQDQISESVGKTAKKIIELETAEENARIARETAARKNLSAEQKAEQSRNRQIAGLQQFNKVTTDGTLAQEKAALATDVAEAQFGRLDARIGRLKDQLLEQLAPLLKLTDQYKDLNITLKKGKKDTDDFFNNTIRRAKELSAFLEKTSFFDATLIFNPEDTKPQQLKQAIEFIERALNRTAGLGGGGLRLRAPIDFEADRFKFIKTSKYFEEQRKLSQEFRDDLQKQINSLTKNNPILIAFSINQAQLKKNGEALRSALDSGSFETIARTIASIFGQASEGALKLNNDLANVAITTSAILTPAFTNLFTAITAGENPLKAFFKSIQQAIGQLIQKLIAAVVQALILKAILGGKGGVNFGDLFKSFAGFRAGGGPVSANGSYIVGENGPEVFTPSRSGTIIPNRGIGSIQGVQGNTVQMVPQIFLRGKDLYLQMSRQQGFNNRNI